jgi:hypothetical protein
MVVEYQTCELFCSFQTKQKKQSKVYTHRCTMPPSTLTNKISRKHGGRNEPNSPNH